MDESYLEWLSSIPGSNPYRARRIAERVPTYDSLRSATRAELASIEGLIPEAIDALLRLLGNPAGEDSSHLFLCLNCGSFVGTAATVCASCGVEFDGSAESGLTEDLDPFLKEEEAPSRICQTCRASMGRDATSCTICGTSVAEASVVPPTGKGIGKDFLARWQRMAPPGSPLSEVDRLHEELDHYDRLLEADSTLERVWPNRAKVLEKLRRRQEAAESLGKAAELNRAREDQYRLEIQNILRTT
ncbi:MAG: hypothetical protein ACREDF_01285, partial [Thermoplasmata archaeon]